MPLRTDKRVLPDFLGIGAQKSATTWLHFCMKQHPEIYVPYIKEVSYFNDNFGRGLGWYQRYFEMQRDQKAIGEITPGYLWCRESALRIFRTIPEARLIVILRNPVDRAFSQYKMGLRGNIVHTDFETALVDCREYIERGFYYTQLKRYLDLFSRERLLILIYDDIVKDPVSVLRGIYSFIGVNESFVPDVAHQVVAPQDTDRGLYGTYLACGRFLRKKLGMGGMIDLYKKTPLVKAADRLFHQFGPFVKSERADDNGRSGLSRLQMSPTTRERLREVFGPEIAQMENLLRRDLSFWK